MNSQSLVTVIGLGSMGLGMAKNMLKSGLKVKGYDLSQQACDELKKAGGIVAKNANDAVKNSDVVVLMVVNEQQVNDILFDKDNISSSLAPQSVLMQCSTISPKAINQIDRKLNALNILLLDAPVSGGKVGADNGSLTIMASGDKTAFSKACAVLDAISTKVYSLGDKPSIGSMYKVAHQLAAGTHLVIAAELMALGKKMGCDPVTLYDIVSNSAGQSWMFKDRVPRMLKEDFAPKSMVDIFIKDLNLVLDTATVSNISLPLTKAAHQMLQKASDMGYAKLDDSAVIKAYETMN